MEIVLFYAAASVSLVATTLVVTRLDASHALIYLIVSLLAIAVIFFLLGAPFAAALEVVIYAGAIMVLFVFVVMMLNQGRRGVDQERVFLSPRMWIGPAALTSRAVSRSDVHARGQLDAVLRCRRRTESHRHRAVRSVRARGRTRVDHAAGRARRRVSFWSALHARTPRGGRVT